MQVRVLTRTRHRGKTYKAGEVCEMTDSIARAHIAHKLAEPAEDKADGEAETKPAKAKGK